MKDVYILRFFNETGAAVNVDVAYHNLVEVGEFEFSKATVSRRVRKLYQEGYLERTDEPRGYYRISDEGREFLNEWS
jgi:predicted transcriptional regulator